MRRELSGHFTTFAGIEAHYSAVSVPATANAWSVLTTSGLTDWMAACLRAEACRRLSTSATSHLNQYPSAKSKECFLFVWQQIRLISRLHANTLGHWRDRRDSPGQN